MDGSRKKGHVQQRVADLVRLKDSSPVDQFTVLVSTLAGDGAGECSLQARGHGVEQKRGGIKLTYSYVEKLDEQKRDDMELHPRVPGFFNR